MNITVTKNQVSINTDYILNDKEYNVNKCYFTFSDEYTDDLVKKAIFVQGTSTIEMSIINNQCQIPAEVLNNGQFELRVYAYEVDGEELLLRYSPSYTTAYVRTGSYIENAESPEVITPTQFEQYMQAMNDGLNEVANVDIDAEQLDNGMSVTITNRYGENKTVYAYDGEKGETGATGATGNGIASITKTSTSGLTDTYTITFTNGNTTIFTVSNGKGIVSVEKTGTNLLADTYTITYNDNTTSSFVIMNGKGIASIELTSTSDLVDTYTITYNDNTTTTYNVTNGNGILSIEKTGTVDNVDTYTIYYTNGTTSTFTVTNSTVTDQEFETLETEVNKYKTLSLLLPKVTGEGSSIELNDTVEGVTIDITPEGNTEQITYSGKNLFDKDNANIMLVLIDSTKLSPRASYRTLYIPITGGETYTISKISSARFRVATTITTPEPNVSVDNYIQNDNATSITITTSSTANYLCVCYYITTETLTEQEILDSIQIEKGSTATDYEPYVGGTASPNPDYPQDIKVVKGNNTIKINGKNLFDYTTTEFSDVSNVNIETSNNVVTIKTTNTTTSNNLFFRTKIPDNMLKNGSTYIISSVNVSGVAKSLQLQLRNKDGSYANKIQNDYVVYDDKYSLYVTGNIFSTTSSTSIPAGTTAIIKNIQVEQGSTATTYSSYTSKTYPINLGNIELCKIGDYQDYIYKSNNTWYKYKAIGKVVLDGSENWMIGNDVLYIEFNGYKRIEGITCICNYYQAIENVNNSSGIKPYNNTIAFRKNPNDTINQVFINDTQYNNVNEFKNWLSTHNTTVYYVLATPTTTEITDTTLINQLNNLYSAVANQDKTFIECTSTDLNNVLLIVKASTYKDISSILNPVMEREE